MGSGVQAESRAKWCFGKTTGAEGGDVTGSTGTGVRFPVLGLARQMTFYVETDAVATCSFQILTARTLTGATAIVSSGTLSTSGLIVYQSTTCPLAYVMPRVKTLNSTANAVIVELYGN